MVARGEGAALRRGGVAITREEVEVRPPLVISLRERKTLPVKANAVIVPIRPACMNSDILPRW